MSDSIAPPSSLPYPPLHRDKKFIALSDWDGTITTFDSNDFMTDNLGFGKERRRERGLDILHGRRTFKDSFKGNLDSVAEKHSFEECKDTVKDSIRLDEGFKQFHQWCKEKDIPVVIVSSGMEPLIRACLSKLLGDEDAAAIDVISNDVKFFDNGKWEIQYRHPTSEFGHDKSQAILPYKNLPNRPTLFFFGDGVSDISAAIHADLLFVKVKEDGENDLKSYCESRKIPFVSFRNFGEALGLVKPIVDGQCTLQDMLNEGKQSSHA